MLCSHLQFLLCLMSKYDIKASQSKQLKKNVYPYNIFSCHIIRSGNGKQHKISRRLRRIFYRCCFSWADLLDSELQLWAPCCRNKEMASWKIHQHILPYLALIFFLTKAIVTPHTFLPEIFLKVILFAWRACSCVCSNDYVSSVSCQSDQLLLPCLYFPHLHLLSLPGSTLSLLLSSSLPSLLLYVFIFIHPSISDSSHSKTFTLGD